MSNNNSNNNNNNNNSKNNSNNSIINNNSNIDEFINGDDICISCTGISYISQEMRSKGQRPICIGKKTIMSKKINPQHYEKLKNTEKKLDKPYIQICIGYLQTYGRRDRLGLPPIFINGIEYNIQKDNKKLIKNDEKLSNNITTKTPATTTTTTTTTTTKKDDDIPYQAALPMIFNFLTPTKEKCYNIINNAKWTYNMIEKGASLQYKFLNNFYKKNSVNLSDRMYKSSLNIIDNGNKTIERLEKAVARMWRK